jgi:integrase-like protein
MAAGIRGRAAKRWKRTTIPDPAAAARADRIRRDFTADASKINARWCGDITYIGTWEGWLYLATVIDIASRRVAGYALADHLRTELVTDALANAVAARDPDPGVIFHSDRGRAVHIRRLRLPRQRLRRHPVPGPHRPVLGQRPFRIVFRLDQMRTTRPSGLAHEGCRQACDRRVHRLVQRHPAARHPGIPQPCRIRRRQQDQEGSLTELSALSVKAGQPHSHPFGRRVGAGP